MISSSVSPGAVFPRFYWFTETDLDLSQAKAPRFARPDAIRTIQGHRHNRHVQFGRQDRGSLLKLLKLTVKGALAFRIDIENLAGAKSRRRRRAWPAEVEGLDRSV